MRGRRGQLGISQSQDGSTSLAARPEPLCLRAPEVPHGTQPAPTCPHSPSMPTPATPYLIHLGDAHVDVDPQVDDGHALLLQRGGGQAQQGQRCGGRMEEKPSYQRHNQRAASDSCMGSAGQRSRRASPTPCHPPGSPPRGSPPAWPAAQPPSPAGPAAGVEGRGSEQG